MITDLRVEGTMILRLHTKDHERVRKVQARGHWFISGLLQSDHIHR